MPRIRRVRSTVPDSCATPCPPIDLARLGLVARPNVLRFAPSLIIPENDIREGMAKLDAAIGTLDLTP